MPEEKLKFVTVELSKKQVDMSHLYHSQNTDKDYARVMAPENGTFFYPTESIKVKKDNPERVYFTRPEGTEIEVHYSKRKEGVPDSAPNDEKYEHYTRTWSSEEIVSLFEDSKKKYRETHSAADRSLADETTESSDENENMEQAAASRRHLRR